MADVLDLSVVIVSWNTRHLLEDCLASVLASLKTSPDLSVEIFVADNDSKDGSAEMVRLDFPEVKLIETGGNLGFARANNFALRQAKGKFWLLLNSDTLVPAGALEGLVSALEKHPDAAVAGPILLNADGSLQASWARFPGFSSELSGALDRSQAPKTVEEMERPDVRQIPLAVLLRLGRRRGPAREGVGGDGKALRPRRSVLHVRRGNRVVPEACEGGLADHSRAVRRDRAPRAAAPAAR